MKPLKLGFEISWRTKADRRFSRSATWKKIRLRVFERDNFTCAYCDYRDTDIRRNEIQINHINGNPKNNNESNLETVCRDCHRILHSGFWALEQNKLEVYQESKYGQNDIIILTRKLRAQGKKDEEIRDFLGLKGPVQWMEELDYLSTRFGFINSNPFKRMPKLLLSEEEQKRRLEEQAGL